MPGRGTCMEPTPLDYALPADGRPRLWRVARPIIALAAVVAALVLLASVPVQRTQNRVDAVTGSTEWQTTWPLGVTSGPVFTASPLEARVTKIGMPWQRDWRMLHVTGQSVFGNVIVRECGSAPPIYDFRIFLRPFVTAASDDEVRGFVRAMQSGTEAEQRAAVDAAADRVVGSPSATRPGG